MSWRFWQPDDLRPVQWHTREPVRPTLWGDGTPMLRELLAEPPPRGRWGWWAMLGSGLLLATLLWRYVI